ncbi:MAG: hypothetical protein GF355_06640 [Candidatus Eisenbacteria bacterium]|nr:hypothetical protein [Candidatus Eisenbacteria bacterium]
MIPSPALALCHSLLITLFNAPGAEPSAEQIADALAVQERAHASLETVFTVSAYAPAPADPRKPADAGRLLERRRIRWHSHDGRLRVEVHSDADAAGGDDDGPPDFIGIWTGDRWVEMTYDEVAEEEIVELQSRPMLDGFLDCAALFNVSGWMSIAGPSSLSESMRNAKESECREDDAEVRCSLVLADSEAFRTTAAVRLEKDPSLRLTSLDLRMLKPAPEVVDDHQTLLRIHYHVEEWAEYGDLALPALAYRDAYVHEDGSAKMVDGRPVIARMIYERISARDRRDDPPPAELFMIPARRGD